MILEAKRLAKKNKRVKDLNINTKIKCLKDYLRKYYKKYYAAKKLNNRIIDDSDNENKNDFITSQ